MINLRLLLVTVVAIFLCFALFSGLIFGAVHTVFSLVLLWRGADVEGTLQSVRRRKTTYRNQHSRRAGREYQLTVSYYCNRPHTGTSSGRTVKTFLSKNWDAFHDIEENTIIPIRVWTRVPGWAALTVDLPGWNNFLCLVVLGSVLAVAYAWVLQKVVAFLLRSLAAEGVDETTSIYCILGASMIIVPVYIAITFSELTKTEGTNQPPLTFNGGSLSQRNGKCPVIVNAVRESFTSIMRKLETERYDYVDHSTNLEMRAMLPQRRDPLDLV